MKLFVSALFSLTLLMAPTPGMSQMPEKKNLGQKREVIFSQPPFFSLGWARNSPTENALRDINATIRGVSNGTGKDKENIINKKKEERRKKLEILMAYRRTHPTFSIVGGLVSFFLSDYIIGKRIDSFLKNEPKRSEEAALPLGTKKKMKKPESRVNSKLIPLIRWGLNSLVGIGGGIPDGNHTPLPPRRKHLLYCCTRG
jgi:hypothetical protein